jgi:hypothetical protein
MNQVATAATSSNPASILENLQLSDAKANMASLSLSVSGCGHRQVFATADDTHPTRTHVLVSRLEIREEHREWLGVAGVGRRTKKSNPARPGGFVAWAGLDRARPDAAMLPPNVSNRTLARLVYGWFTTVAPG